MPLPPKCPSFSGASAHPAALDAKRYPTSPPASPHSARRVPRFSLSPEQAKLVLTDSGGIQEETTTLGVPCLTLRENTERPITISQGTNVLVGTDPGKIVAAARDTLAGKGIAGRIPPLWDGHTAKRIVDILLQEVPRACIVDVSNNS